MDRPVSRGPYDSHQDVWYFGSLWFLFSGLQKFKFAADVICKLSVFKFTRKNITMKKIFLLCSLILKLLPKCIDAMEALQVLDLNR